MRLSTVRFAAIAFGALLLAGAASAQTNQDDETFDDSVGAREFRVHCAVCHGEDGRGHGQLAELMTVPVADLTQIRKNNDGDFPIMKIFKIIDGRTGVRGHGYPMPVWGDRFMDDAEKQFGPFQAEAIVRGRILELVFYLQTIQE